MNDNGIRIDPKRKKVIDELLNLTNQISVEDIERYVEDIRLSLQQRTMTDLPTELQQKIMSNLDYKSLSRLRQVNKTSKAVADTLIRKNVTEQISVELLDKIICLPYFLFTKRNYGRGQLSGRKDITITGDKYGNQFVGTVRINGSIYTTLQDEDIEIISETPIKGEGYFDTNGNPHFKLIMDFRDGSGKLFWNEDNRYIYFIIYEGGEVGVSEIKRTKYSDDELRILGRAGRLRGENRLFYADFNNEWTTDLVRFNSIMEAIVEDYKIINIDLPELGNRIAARRPDDSEDGEDWDLEADDP